VPVLSERWMSVIRVLGVCAAGTAVAGLGLFQPGVMMVGLILAVLSAYVIVMQASIRQASLRRAGPGICKRCGYEHEFTQANDDALQRRCPECGEPIQ
jgi:hypothetical protein